VTWYFACCGPSTFWLSTAGASDGIGIRVLFVPIYRFGLVLEQALASAPVW